MYEKTNLMKHCSVKIYPDQTRDIDVKSLSENDFKDLLLDHYSFFETSRFHYR
jgi:hypothetical protein